MSAERSIECGHPNHGGADHDCAPFLSWGERPEDVLLCTHQEELGHCSLPYGHGGWHVLPSAESRPCSCGISVVGAETSHASEAIAHRAYPEECIVISPGIGGDDA